MFKLDKIVLELLEYFALVGVAVPFYPWDQKSVRPGKISHSVRYGNLRGLCVRDCYTIQNLCGGMRRHMFRYGTLKNWLPNRPMHK